MTLELNYTKHSLLNYMDEIKFRVLSLIPV